MYTFDKDVDLLYMGTYTLAGLGGGRSNHVKDNENSVVNTLRLRQDGHHLQAMFSNGFS